MTVLEWITEALSDLEVLAAGATPAPEDAVKALSKFNAWLDQLATERLMMAAVTKSSVTVTAGLLTVSGTPTLIEHVARVDSNGYEIELTKLSDGEYADISDKAMAGDASHYHYNRVTGVLTCWPVGTFSARLYVPTGLAELAAGDTLVIPKGYRRFLVTNGALELAPAFGAQPHAWLVEAARDSRLAVKAANPSPPVKLRTADDGMPGTCSRSSYDAVRGW